MIKKFGSAVLAVILISSMTLPLTSCGKSDNKALVCDENGDFTILIVSDPQCDTKAQWEEARDELETLVERAEPDFVIINGDMNTKNVIPSKMWEHFISPLTDRGIYWSTTNGNHDSFRAGYYAMYGSYDTCLNSRVPMDNSNFQLSRPMNYVIPVYSNDGERTVFAIYGMDSGESNENGYEGVTEKQIKWYEAESDKLTAMNGGKPVTSLMCMHIPLTQTIDMFYSADDGGTAEGKKAGGLYQVYGVANEPELGMEDYICENGTIVPETWFQTTAPENDRGMFESIQRKGDVKAVIFGHDHRTNFIGSYKGVLLGFAGKLSTGCYSDELCRGGRVIRFNQSAPEKFTASWIGSLETSKDQPAIYSDGKAAGS